jgi:hypothetical protein
MVLAMLSNLLAGLGIVVRRIAEKSKEEKEIGQAIKPALLYAWTKSNIGVNMER